MNDTTDRERPFEVIEAVNTLQRHHFAIVCWEASDLVSLWEEGNTLADSGVTPPTEAEALAVLAPMSQALIEVNISAGWMFLDMRREEILARLKAVRDVL